MKLKSLYLLIAIACTSLLLTSCGDKTEDPPVEPAKTLNKTTLLNKKWYNKGSTIVHEFKSTGVYGGGQGSWKWVNNSDTIETKDTPTDNPLYWKIWWNTDHEMTCEWIGNGGQRLFKDAAW